jgi:hypothetical protein
MGYVRLRSLKIRRLAVKAKKIPKRVGRAQPAPLFSGNPSFLFRKQIGPPEMIGSLIQAGPILDDLPPFSKEINEPDLE